MRISAVLIEPEPKVSFWYRLVLQHSHMWTSCSVGTPAEIETEIVKYITNKKKK